MKLNRPKENDIRRHFIFVEVPVDIVGPEAISWQESTWWPKRCLLKFIREDEGDFKVGTKFQQKISLPLLKAWDGEVTKLVPDVETERIYSSNMFKAKESISVEKRINGTRVDHRLEIQMKGFLSIVIWLLFLRGAYDSNIKLIFSALKEHVLEKAKEAEEQ